MSNAWQGGSDTRWRRLRAAILRLHLPEHLRPPCAIATPGICTEKATCVDHIIPLSMGGSKYDPTNCRPACEACNLARKRTQIRDEPPPRQISNW